MPRPISTTSRKPRVQTIAAFGSRRVISAFVATVVPWQNRAVSERSTPACSTPAITPSIGSAVEATLATCELAAGLVEHAHVGEGAADVDGDHASVRVHATAPCPERAGLAQRVDDEEPRGFGAVVAAAVAGPLGQREAVAGAEHAAARARPRSCRSACR